MTKYFLLFVLIAWVCISERANAQFDTEFWFAAPELTQSTNEASRRDWPIQLVVSTLEKPAVVTVSLPADPTFAPLVQSIPANATRIFDLRDFVERLESKPHNTILKNGLFIKATSSISAYYEVRSSNNTDIFALKGENAKGRLFYTPFQTHWNNSLANGNIQYNPTTYASFDVVATDDTTNVTITPAKPIVGHPAGVPFTITLNRGQVYSCRAIDRFGVNRPYGSKIESDKDVSVTVKDDMLRFYNDTIPGSAQSADVAGDQLIPVEFTGTDYILIKGGLHANNDRTYILATEDNTVVRLNGVALPVATLNRGQQYELTMTEPSYYLKASKKVYAWHISGIDDQVAGAVIPALSCTGTNQIGFNRTTSAQYILNVITRTEAKNSFTLNGNPNLVPGSAFQPVAGSNGWVFARITFSTSQIPAGSTLLLKNSSTELFHVGVTNYAAGVGSNYGYFSNFSRLNLGTLKSLCVGDTAVLDAGPAKTSYLWSTGATTRFIETQDPGKYWVTTLSGSECPKSDTVRVRFYEPTFNIGPDDTLCPGATTLIQPNGVFTFTWQDGTTNPTYLATQPGVYWAQVADFQGCTTRDSLVITEAPRPATPVASGSDTVCRGVMVSLAMEEVPNATYAWVDPANHVISGKNILVNTATQPAGAYKAFVNVGGCESFFDTAQVGVVLPPGLELGNDTVSCQVGGSVVLDPGTHVAGTTYLWDDNSVDTIRTVSTSGLYSVRVTNPFGCFDTDSVRVTFQQLPLSVTFSGPTSYCSGTDASFGVEPQAGLEYQWTGPNGFSTSGPVVHFSSIQVNQAGNYTVTPILNSCAGASSTVSISVAASPEVSLGSDTSACNAFTLVLDPVIGGAGLTYQWNDNSTDSTLTVSQEGTYSVAVSNGVCISTDTIVVDFGVGPAAVTFTGANSFCEGQFVSFGVVENGSETYAWTGPNGFNETGNVVNFQSGDPLFSGEYTVVASLPGCAGTPISRTITITPVPAISLGPDLTLCPQTNLTLDPTNPNEELFYVWNNGSADSSISISTGGTYSVKVTRDGICYAEDTILVTTGIAPQAVTFTGTMVYCPGSDASFGVEAQADVTYAWSGPAGFTTTGPTVSIPQLQAAQTGRYYVTPSLNGCQGSTDSVTVSLNPDAPQVSFPSQVSICNGMSIVLDPLANGGSATYLWSTGSTDSSIVATQPGVYKVVVSRGICSDTDSVNVQVGTTPNSPAISGETNLCNGQSALLSVDAQSDVVYTWSGPGGFTASGASITIPNLQSTNAGMYIVSAALMGCFGTPDTVNLEVNATPIVDLGPDLQVCNGLPVTLDPILNDQGFTYLWSNTSVDSSITVNQTGQYSVTVSTGASSCMDSDTIQVNVGVTPPPVVFSGTTDYCAGAGASFGVDILPGVLYNWSGPSGFSATGNMVTIGTIQVNQSGYYKVTTSNNGCMGTPDSVFITVRPSPVVNLGNNQTVCPGQSVVLDPVEFGGGFTYTWTPASTDSAITVSDSGTYMVTVTSGGTCSASDTVHIAFGTPPANVTFSGQSGFCTGANASFGVVAQPNITYNWTGPNSFVFTGATVSIPNIQLAQGGTYSVTATLNGCTSLPATIQVQVSNGPVVNLGPNDTICGNLPVTLDPGNGQPGYNYEWSIIGVTDSFIVVNQTGSYAVTVSFGGCSRADTIDLTFNQNPLPVTIEGDANQCVGDTLVLSLQGTQAGVQYNWTGPFGLSLQGNTVEINGIQPAQAGTYQVTPVSEGCSGIASTLTISVTTAPVPVLGPDIALCSSTSFVLDPITPSSGLTFLWNTGSTDTSIVVNQTGMYVVTIANAQGCKSSDTLNATFTVPSPVVFTGTTSFCVGSGGTFGVVNTPGLSATWSGPNGFAFTGTSITLDQAAVQQTGYYVVTPTVSGCVGAKDSILVQILETPTVNLGADTAFCGTSPFQLNAPTGTDITYMWSTLSTEPSIQVSATGLYYVTVTRSEICSSTDSIRVTFNAMPQSITVVDGSKQICEGTLATFGVQQMIDETYTWSGPNAFAATGASIQFQGNLITDGTYTVTPLAGNCVGSPVSLLLTIKPLPQISINAGSMVCKGAKALATATYTNGAGLLWSDASSVNPASFGVGQHWATATLNGCSVADTFLIINSGPTANFEVGNNGQATVYQLTTFTDQSVAGQAPLVAWEWKLGFAQIQTTQNASYTYTTTGVVDVQLIVKDQAGCSDTLVRPVTVGEIDTWFIPTLFSPNGDGDNDYFEIGELTNYPGTEVHVYDRWGKPQFSSNNYDNTWDGGNLVEGVYYYSVKRGGDRREFNGYVYLKR